MKHYTSGMDPGRTLARSLRRRTTDGWVRSRSSPGFRGAAELVPGRLGGRYPEFITEGFSVSTAEGDAAGMRGSCPETLLAGGGIGGARSWGRRDAFPRKWEKGGGPAWRRLLPGNMKTRAWVGLSLCWVGTVPFQLGLSEAVSEGSPWSRPSLYL